MPYVKDDARSTREYRLLAKILAIVEEIEGGVPDVSSVDHLVKVLVAP